MSQVEDQAGLIEDLITLARSGSGQEALNSCPTLLSLLPVVLAVRSDVVLPYEAARALLEIVAKESGPTSTYVQASAGLTGIDPPDTRRGVRDEKGPEPRQKHVAKKILGGIRPDTVRKNAPNYHAEYASAVLKFVRKLDREPEEMAKYLLRCEIKPEKVALLIGPPASASDTPTPAYLDGLPSRTGINNEDRQTVAFARSIPLSGAVERALGAASEICAARNRKFYTVDLLVALLEMPGSLVVICLEEANAGLAGRLREDLGRMLGGLAAREGLPPYVPFNWIEIPEVCLAQDLVATDGAPTVTELYLLLGVLAGKSNTRQRLEIYLKSDYERLRLVAEGKRRCPNLMPGTPLDPGSG